MNTYTLNNGIKIPNVGFGAYKGEKESIETALNYGYRMLDTALYYKTEDNVSKAIKDSKVKREDVFITSKVWKDDMGYENTLKAFNKTLENLETDYLDLYLVHWPNNEEDNSNKNWKELDIETWKAMEEIYNSGRAKAIGVSNFLLPHLKHLMKHANIMPMANEIEFHPGYMQSETLAFCNKHNIQVIAWQPIARGKIFDDVLIKELAHKYNKTSAQICIKFCIQCSVIPLARSNNEDRIKSNFDVFDFEISEEDMDKIKCMPPLGWSGEHPDRKRVYFK